MSTSTARLKNVGGYPTTVTRGTERRIDYGYNTGSKEISVCSVVADPDMDKWHLQVGNLVRESYENLVVAHREAMAMTAEQSRVLYAGQERHWLMRDQMTELMQKLLEGGDDGQSEHA